MIINTARFGNLQCNKEDIIVFPKGILGFPEEHEFVLLRDVIQAPFAWLQSVTTPHLAFVVLDPWVVCSDYQLDVSKEVEERLDIKRKEEVMTLGIVVIPENPEKMTINLRAPIVINIEKKLGEQIILSCEKYSIRYPILGSK